MDMKRKKIILVGAGGHAKVIIDTIISCGEYEIVGMIDNATKDFNYRNIKIIGTDNDLLQFYKDGIKYAFVCVGYLGKTTTRNRIYKNLKDIGFTIPVIIDNSAIVAKDAIIGEGTYVGKLAVLNADSKIGKMCIINTKAVIEHDTIVRDFSHISVNATVCGGCSIENDVLVGANATIIQGIHIGQNSIIGAGVTVIRSVNAGKTVVGIDKEI